MSSSVETHCSPPERTIPAESRVHHVPLDDTLMVVTDDFLLTAPVLKLVLRPAPDAAFDPEALLAAVRKKYR